MADRPLAREIDAVIDLVHARARADSVPAIREVLDEYAAALSGGMRASAFRETERGAEILILRSNRITLIGTDFDEVAVRFETRFLRDAVVSLETAELHGTPVSAKRRWRFTFPDGDALSIEASLRGGRPDDLDMFATLVMAEVDPELTIRQPGESADSTVSTAPPAATRHQVTDIWGNPLRPRRRNR